MQQDADLKLGQNGRIVKCLCVWGPGGRVRCAFIGCTSPACAQRVDLSLSAAF